MGFASPGNVRGDYAWQPRHQNCLLLSSDPENASNSTAPAQGVISLTRILVPETESLTNFLFALVTPGSGAQLPVNVFGGFYDSSGLLLGVTAALDAVVQGAAGVKSAVLTAVRSLTVIGGKDVFIFGAFLIGTQSTVATALARPPAGQPNFNLPAASTRGGTIGAGLVALPDSIIPANITLSGIALVLGAS